MELTLRDGDYVFDGVAGLRRAQGQEALLQRVLFRLTARRGGLVFREELGSRLWQRGRVPQAARQAAAMQYVTEALAEEAGVTVKQVTLAQKDGRAALTAELDYEGAALSVTLDLQI